MQTALTVPKCENCLTRMISAIRNTQLVDTLLRSIAERFSKVLHTSTWSRIAQAEPGRLTSSKCQPEHFDVSLAYWWRSLRSDVLHQHEPAGVAQDEQAGSTRGGLM